MLISKCLYPLTSRDLQKRCVEHDLEVVALDRLIGYYSKTLISRLTPSSDIRSRLPCYDILALTFVVLRSRVNFLPSSSRPETF